MVTRGRTGNEAATESGYRFRVSDAAHVPLRGHLLRLRLLEGRPVLDDLRPGRKIVLRAPDGEERVVRVLDFSVTGGRATQRRLERTGELDIVIPHGDAVREGRSVDIGWHVLGPAPAQRGRAA